MSVEQKESDSLIVSQKLLKSKKKVSDEEKLKALNGVWYPFLNDKNKNKNVITEINKNDITWVLRETPNINDYYDIRDTIGNPGQYGIVKLGINKKDNKKYAIKVINKTRFKTKKSYTLSFFDDIRTEIYLLYHSHDHPSIITLYNVFEDIKNVYLILEYCNGGELFEYIQNNESFNEYQASIYMKQMLSSVYYLHNLNICHCDLKPENFLFKDQKYKYIKLIDFGMAKIIKWRNYYKKMNGTPYYIAPEVLNGHYNESCDMWSLGIILYIMIFGYPPFFDFNEKDHTRDESDNIIYDKIKKGFTPKILPNYGPWFPKKHPISNNCRDLISRLLRSNVADRITAEEALEHPFILTNININSKNTKILKKNTTILPTIFNSFKEFNYKNNDFKQYILKLLKECKYLNTNQVNSVKDFFKSVDKNGDNKISLNELYNALKDTDPDITLNNVKKMFKDVDFNNDGYLDYDELLSLRINRKLQLKEERIKKVFKALDLDSNGKISADELKTAMNSVSKTIKISKSKCLQLIKDADKDGDGEIDFEEFIQLFQSKIDIN